MQPPVIVFPDVEMWATTYLRAALSGRPESFASNVYVSNSVPDTRRDRMVVVRRDGGPRLDTVREAARLGVRVWATSEPDATDLARLIRALLWMAPDGNPVCKVNDLSGPSPVADESKQPLRFFTVELIVRGAPFDNDIES